MPEDTKKLTLEDPVDADTLKKLGELREARLQVAERHLDMESEQVRLMVMARQLDAEKNRIFEKILADRGLPPTFPVNIDGTTGKLSPLANMPQPQPPPPAEKPAG